MNKQLLDALQNYRITMVLCLRTFADATYLNGESNAQFKAFLKADADLCKAIAEMKVALDAVPATPSATTNS